MNKTVPVRCMDRKSYSTTHSNTINKGNIRNFQVANKMIELIFLVKEFTLLWGTFNREKVSIENLSKLHPNSKGIK